MPTIRERIAKALLGKEQSRLEEATRRLYNAYLEGPYLMTPENLLSQLQEVDSALLQDFVNQVGWETIGSVGYGATEPTEGERLRAVDESRRLYRYDVITQWVVWLWTNFGFGETITVTPENEKALEVWNEFWYADRNQGLLADDELQALSEDLLVDGEKFMLVFISTIDGMATLREMDTREVVEIVTHPDDKSTRLFYKRTWLDGKGSSKEIYYPDWLAFITGELDRDYLDPFTGETKNLGDVLPKGATRADQVNEATVVCCLHIPHNRKGGMRGWPLMSAGAAWSRAHKKFREDRTAVSSAVAMFVRKLKVQGGSRAVDTMRSRLATTLSAANAVEGNAPAVAGSTFVENNAADLQNMPLTTGAGDAKTDGEALLTMAGLGGGVYPHWIGAGDAYRLATATSMEAPMYREFSRYQSFWAAQFKKLVRIVLWSAETYGGMKFESYRAEVSTDKLLQTDLGQLVTGLTGAFNSLMTPYAASIPVDTQKQLLATAWRLVLQTLGVSDVDALTSEEAFGVGVVPAPPAAPSEAAVQEFTPCQSLEEIRGEYQDTLAAAMLDYLDSNRPVTSFRNEFRRAVNDAFTGAFYAGWAEAGPSTGPIDDDATDWLLARIEQEIGYSDDLFAELKAQRGTEDIEAWAEGKAETYTDTLDSIYNQGKVMGAEGLPLTFGGDDGEESCETCQGLKGVTHPARWWVENNLIPGQPGNENYDCKGYRCQHGLFDQDGNLFVAEMRSERE